MVYPAGQRPQPLQLPDQLNNRNVEVNRQVKQVALKIIYFIATLLITGILASFLHPYVFTAWAGLALTTTLLSVPGFLEDIHNIN